VSAVKIGKWHTKIILRLFFHNDRKLFSIIVEI
jgi:hypothetical protein